MINIIGKEWSDLTSKDIEAFLLSPETEESFFFEFKDDRVDTKKISEEISALANTYGGYIFLGVSDSKSIDGCKLWNEQRIHSVIHDTITPTPSFDIKKLIICDKTIYVIRIDEGSEPPYITSQGKIFERLSSGSFIVKDSSRLTQMYDKNERQLNRMEKKISIPPLLSDLNNVYGYIDMGFVLTVSDTRIPAKIFSQTDLKTVVDENVSDCPIYSFTRIGNSFVYTPGGLSTNINGIPAHLNNFIEIMYDGSARMRVLLSNNDSSDTTVNMLIPFQVLYSFRQYYQKIMGELFPAHFISAKKYEALTVIKQFQPVFFYEPNMIKNSPKLAKENQKFIEFTQNKSKTLGLDNVITDDRIPKTGLATLDKRVMQRLGINDFTSTSITHELFYSRFVDIGFPFGVDFAD